MEPILTIKELRERSKWTQQEIADGVGVSISAVQKWDQGKHFPQLMPIQFVRLRELLSATDLELENAQALWEEAVAAKTEV